MNSGDNSDQMPAKSLAEVVALEDPNQNKQEKRTVVGGMPPVDSPHNEDGGERKTMQKRNMGKKLRKEKTISPKPESQDGDQLSSQSGTDITKSASTRSLKRERRSIAVQKAPFNEQPYGDLTLKVLVSLYGPNVKLWLEAQEMHLRREEAQKVFSATIEALCKDRTLKEELRNIPIAPTATHPLALILKRCVDCNYLLGTRDLKKFEKELKRFGFDLGTTHLTLRGFMIFSAALQLPEIKQLLAGEDWQSLSREVKFLEILLELYNLKLIQSDDNTGNLYSALSSELKASCGRFDGDLRELIKLREILDRDSVKKHLNGTRLAGQSPEDRFLSLLLTLVEKEGLNPDTDYRLVYGALPLKRKRELTDCQIKINYLTQLRRALERDSIKALLKECSKLSLSPEELFIEFVLALRAEKLVAPEMTEAQIFSSLPPKVRGEMKFVEMPYTDIANFRSFFSGQSVQARLHMLLGSDKTPWQKFEELNALLYDPTNEATHGIMRGTLPEDYFELHSWLPPKLRCATSPVQDEEDPKLQPKDYEDIFEAQEETEDTQTEQRGDNDKGPEISPQLIEDHTGLDQVGVSSNNDHTRSIRDNETFHGEGILCMDEQNLGSAEDKLSNHKPLQSRVALGFTPRFGDHSIRQKTSLRLTGYRSMSPQHSNTSEGMDYVTDHGVIDRGISDRGVTDRDVTDLGVLTGVSNTSKGNLEVASEQIMAKEVVNPPIQIFEVDSDDLKSLSNASYHNLDADEYDNYAVDRYQPGRTWGDSDDVEPDGNTDNVAIQSPESKKGNIGASDTSIELGLNETHSSPFKEEYGSEPEVSDDLGKCEDQSEIGSNQQISGYDMAASLRKEDSGYCVLPESSIMSEVTDFDPASTIGMNFKEGFDPETCDSLSDHLAYTAASKITPEERLLEFAVFLNRNKLLATTKSFQELFEKLPTDIRPEFKMVDLDLGKFLEFRQDISRHFVKEHLRSTKENGLEGEDRFAEFIGFLKRNGLMPQLPDSAEVYKLIPISLKREFGNVLSNEPVNAALRKNLEMEVVKEYISTLEVSALSPENRLIELGIFLHRNGLLASTENLIDLYTQLPFDMRRNFKGCSANLTAISSIRSILEKEMIKEQLKNTKEAYLSDEERFIELVIFLERNELVNKGTSPSEIYMALPSQLKDELKMCNFPTELVIQVRDCLEKPPVQAQIELVKKMWFSHQEKFMELAVFLRQNGYMPTNVDAGLLFCGLPANLKKDLTIIDMPLDAVVQLRKNLEREFVKAHIKSGENDHLSPEERFVELIVFLSRNELMPDFQSLDEVYTALPAELRLEFSRTEIPIDQILLFRDILDKESVRAHWNRSKSLGGSEEDRFTDLVVFLKKEGLLIFEDNLGYFFTALPIEFKRELSNFVFKVDTITRLKSAIKAAEAARSF